MITALEIGLGLSVVTMIVGFIAAQPKPKPVRVRTRDVGLRQR